MKHAVIEDASIELLELFDEVSNASKKEKHSKIDLNRMHFWWTRKPLIVGRAIILSSILNDITKVKKSLLLDLEKPYKKNIPQSESIKKIMKEDIKILDPFGGAGNLIFESGRLGFKIDSSDYNPVAYIIQKSILEYPQKYGISLRDDFEKCANKLIQTTKNELEEFYLPTDLSYIWAWCIICPHCDQRFPLMSQMYISKKSPSVGIKINLKSKKIFEVQIINNITKEDGSQFTKQGRKAICLNCKNSIDYKQIVNDISTRKDKEIIAVQIQNFKKRSIISPNDTHRSIFNLAEKKLNKNLKKLKDKRMIPDETIFKDPRSPIQNYGIYRWDQFFNSRQLLFLTTLLNNMDDALSEIKTNEKKKIIATYLGLLISKSADANSLGVHWNTVAQKPEFTMASRRPSFMLNGVEINPFQSIGGSLSNNLNSITRTLRFIQDTHISCKVSLKSVTDYDESKEKFDLIITDPPYGDDVQYGELSDFYYVWLYRALKPFYNELPSRVRLDEDFCESKGRFEIKKHASKFFENGLKKAFNSMSGILKNDGLCIIFFAHSSPKAWGIFLNSIRSAKLRVVSSYAIHTELTSSYTSYGKTSFQSSIVVSCRKILEPSEVYFEDLIPQIEDKIKNMLKKIPNEKLLSLPITDLLIMVYGQVLEVSTQHTTLKSYEKDSSFEFDDLVKDARSFIMKELVGKITGKSLNVIGPRMAFYLLIKIFHKGIIAGDDAIKISQTYDVKIENLEKDQVVIKDKDVIRVCYLNENEIDYSPDNVEKSNLYQQLCYLAYTADSRGLDKIPTILSMDNFRAEDLKQVISLLIKNYHLRRNKGESLNPKEQRELEILESLGDTVGVKSEGTMDSFL